MKTVTYTCDCCSKSARDEMGVIKFIARDTHGYGIACLGVGHLCKECESNLKNEILNSFKELELKYSAASIEPGV
ncbi:hypothetical protein [Pragia fontium]|uniref:Uncharacterized protein n=1 Tax=Pragia fontium DSM 5563 = ATCC 49100 TaxID=1122977 RepID=A0AAJ5BGL5_9GAMM|nr:hypothetical protein [Pragia fontium]SFC48970.1 hypothetical protein SAMN02745723_102492 [Pragia fontium DSM 5563 = ATCC 49100]